MTTKLEEFRQQVEGMKPEQISAAIANLEGAIRFWQGVADRDDGALANVVPYGNGGRIAEELEVLRGALGGGSASQEI